ncbi:MAG: erythromycin biosynthesis sensory transduction protein eryC1 [Candidatus Marinimicrobia bacterium]|nr:erythromycin biosynthesis sensory transduction protein eryC1 [Candidatus Neomarinimicrobiota bacterium]
MKKIPFVDLKIQYKNIKNEIDNAIQIVLNETAFIKGKYVEEFEKKFAKQYGVKHCISCGNGTDAIYISLKALDIGLGDEVITVANSWISTSETISQSGAKPIFVDINEYYNIDTKKIEKKINSKTKAIIPVHLYGQPAEMSIIKKICKKYNLFLIEDCAQAHFAQWNEKKVGTIGDMGTFSFFPGKNLGAYGDAGCIITNDDKFAVKARMFANHGSLIKHQHKIEGINSRLDGLQAAILSVKLKYIDKWTESRIKNAKLYTELLSSIQNVQTPKIHSNAKHVFHLYVIRCDSRDKLNQYLNANGVSTSIHYPTPLPLLKAYDYLKLDQNDYPVSKNYKNQILSLPMFPELSKGEIVYITDLIKDFYK